jgi:ribonuclease Z
MVKIIFTGSGIPAIQRLDDVKACASEAILIGDDVLLFDCGRHVSSQLLRSGVPPYEVNYLFFTHIFHFDHTCDYSNLLFSRTVKDTRPLNVFGPKGTIEFTDNVIKAYVDRRGPRIMENVSVRDIGDGFVHGTDSWQVECVNTTHGSRFNQLSLAYKITAEGKSIVVSGDITIPSLEAGTMDDAYALNGKLIDLAKDVDLFIMDACLTHTTPEGLAKAAQKANARKVAITHLLMPGTMASKRAIQHYGGSKNAIFVQPEYDEFISQINKIYEGEVIAAEDLKSITI